jgi:hypothetical protein
VIGIPQLLIGAFVAVILSGAGGYLAGRHDGRKLEAGEQDRAAQAIAQARLEMEQVTSAAIQKIEVRNVTIRQKAETVTREVPVYRDCKHDADGLRLINEALAPGWTEPARQGKLPRDPDPADR